MNGLEIFNESFSMALKEWTKKIGARVIAEISGVPYKEPLPLPPPPYDPKPLHDALKADGLEIGVAMQHGHGYSDEIPYLYYKNNSWFSLSADAYTELIRLARIGLEKIERDEDDDRT